MVKSKWIKELHIKPETLKYIEEKVGKSLEDMGTGEKFLNRTAILDLTAQAIAVLFRNFFPVPISSRLFPTFSSISFSVSVFM